MKTMTCKQLGGSCDTPFQAETFEEIAKQSQTHGLEMAQANDPEHSKAMEKMRELMKNPHALSKWIEDKKTQFDSLPEN